MLNSDARYVLGVDPGIQCGFSVFDRKEQKLVVCKSCELWDLFESLKSWKPNGVFVFIENPNTWVPFKSKDGSNDKRSGAGAVKQTYKHITQYLDHLCIGYQTVKLQGTMKKVDATKFKMITKWEGKSNEHSRDSALMCFNR